MSAAAFFARWRVRLGYPQAAVVLWLARPSPKSILVGMVVGAIGLWLRARAAGRLRKQEVLTTSGPYAYTRNPLYLGSFILAIGAAIAAHSWLAALILFSYFALFYSAALDGREAHVCDCRSVFLRAIQEKSRVPRRDWFPIAAPRFSCDLALALVVDHCRLLASREESR